MITVVVANIFLLPLPVLSEEEQVDPLYTEQPEELTLFKAVMCEKIVEYVPRTPAVVFPTALETVSCFTSFDPVPEQTLIYHNWFFRDKLSTKIKLSLQPPRWSTFSVIQLREADKGPWRVEITDRDGRVFSVLRFSITD